MHPPRRFPSIALTHRIPLLTALPPLLADAVTFDRTNPAARTMGIYKVPAGSRVCAGCGGATLGAARTAELSASATWPLARPKRNSRLGYVGEPLQPTADPSAADAERLSVHSTALPARATGKPLGLSMANLRVPTWLRERRARFEM